MLCNKKAADLLRGAAFVAPGIRATKPDFFRSERIINPEFQKCKRIYKILFFGWFCIYNLPMVTYDEVKRQANIKNHGLDFLGSEAVFEGFTITREDARDAYGELRLQTLGLWNGIVVFVVHTARGNADHVISIRKAEKHEERIYWKNFPD
jgi:hypothetical protein